MDSNRCAIDDNHSNVDSLLPPRKRLLAGLKRNNSDVKHPADSGVVDESNAQTDSSMKSLLSNHPHRSYEEIVEASRIAASIAIAARANAEEKAANAARAIAAAKKALELVSNITEKVEKFDGRSKKHRPVQTLCSRNKGHGNGYGNGTDEELARKLHQAINSSPRISKNPSVADDKKNHKHRKLKSVAFSGKASIDYNVDQPSTDTNMEAPVNKVGMETIDLNVTKPDEDRRLRLDDDEKQRLGEDHQQNLENSQREEIAIELKGKQGESFNGLAKKRGRPKQKKMSLSILSSNEEGQDRSPLPLSENNDVNDRSMSVEMSSSLRACRS